MKKLIVLIICIFTFLNLFSQKQNYNWFFGNKMAMTFLPDGKKPIILNNSALNSWEGCASISDSNGNLLFYTDGVTVYNKNHQIMPNGTGLLGGKSNTATLGSSSAQSSLIIPIPNQNNLFFIFTTDCAEDSLKNGFCYSVVNMSYDNGNGDVVKKNILLHQLVCENLTGTLNSNGKDYWVLVHESETNAILAYKVNELGIDTIPIVSKIGKIPIIFTIFNYDAAGYLQLSTDGKKLAHTMSSYTAYTNGILELFDFNNSTGVVSNYILLDTLPSYGVEFSRNSKKLYHPSRGQVFQYDVSTSNSDSILNSKVRISFSPGSFSFYGMQLAPDDRIYLMDIFKSAISVINYPDSTGVSCGFEPSVVDFSPKQGYLGLPNFLKKFAKTNTCNLKISTINSQASLPDTNIVAGDTVCIDLSLDFNDKATSDLLLRNIVLRIKYNLTLLNLLNLSSPVVSSYHLDNDTKDSYLTIFIDSLDISAHTDYSVNLCYLTKFNAGISNLDIVSIDYLDKNNTSIHNGSIKKGISGVKSESFDNDITINQIENTLEININEKTNSNLTLKIFNVLGEQVYINELGNSNNCKMFDYDLSYLNNGVYFCNLYDNHTNTSKKLFVIK